MTTTIRQPKVTVNIVNASETVGNTAQRILFVGQKTPAGSAVAGALVESIANGGAEDALFGRNGMLATMIRANKVRNQQVQVDAIALDDNGSGVDATGTIVVTGPATEAGTLTVIAGSERNFKFSIAVASKFGRSGLNFTGFCRHRLNFLFERKTRQTAHLGHCLHANWCGDSKL